MTAVLAVTGTELRRFWRDRSNIFFVFMFPLLLVLVLGSQFGVGGSKGQVSVTGEAGSLQRSLIEELSAQELSVEISSAAEVREQVARGRADVGVFIPDGSETSYQMGEMVILEVLPGSAPNFVTVEQRVRTAVETLQLHQAQFSVLTAHGMDPAAVENALDMVGERARLVTMQVYDVDEIAQEFTGLGQYDLGAVSQLLLFVFLVSLVASGTLIRAGREGVITRSLAAPVKAGQVLGGLALGRFTLAVFQGCYIMAATALLFSVDWGNPWLAVLILMMFSAVATGVAMLLGSVMDNEGAAVGVGVGIGLVLAAVGGGMAPLEIFSDSMRRVAHVTPHAWAYDAFAKVQRHDGSLFDIVPQLGVLAAMAALLLLLGSWAIGHAVARAM